jgi:acyl-CoA thioester hydrolase
MESAEHELLRTAGVPVVDRRPDGVDASWPRVSASCDYVSSVRFGDEVTIAASVAQIGRTSVTYTFEFQQSGRLVAKGRVVAVRCLMHSGRKPEAVLIPHDIIARLEPFQG